MRTPKIIFVVILSFVFSYQVFSGTTGKIAGQILDAENGEPLIGVNVILDGTTMGATTDLEGFYVILNIPPGQYTLQFLYIGYKEVKVSNVNVKVDYTTTQNMELSVETMELDEAIEVVAEKELVQRDLTSSKSTVSSEEIASVPVEQMDEVLQLQAGVSRDEGGGFHIRGGRSSEVAYWVDGAAVTDVYDGSNGVEIENNAIQSLQVISGTFNAEYGQSMSGIVNIVTKDGGDLYHGNVSTYVGDYLSNESDIFYNIDDVNPTHIQDIRLNLSGPIPFTNDNLTFFTNWRYNYNDGYMYGQRQVNTDGSTGDFGSVQLNQVTWLTSQNKLTYRLTDLLKFRLGFNYDNRDFREYDHYYKYNPDGNFDKFQESYNLSFTVDHTLNSRAFYTFKLSRFIKKFWQYVYEDPEDLRYVDNNLPEYSTSAFQFSKGGQQLQHFSRETLSDLAKFEMSYQVSNKHLLKFGAEGRLYNMDLLDYQTIDGAPTDSIFVPTKPGPDNYNYAEYTFEPVELSFYIQDKMEYGDFIINLGLRFDYFDSKGLVLADPKDPSLLTPLSREHEEMSDEERAEIWYKDPSVKTQISPRIGLAFPISAAGVIHASYGHFSQIPEFRLLYQNPGFKIQSGQDNLMGNADLEPQRTISYEIGLQQKISTDVSFDITGFYRDVRNWVGTSPLIETYRPNFFYSEYENRDYANVRGVTVAVTKSFSNNFSGNIAYTVQTAEGNASDPEDAFNDIKNDKEPRKTIIPLNWDQRHILNANLFLGFGPFNIGLLGRLNSGQPYTPQPIQGTTRGSNVSSGFSGLADNSERRPNNITLDLQMFYDFFINMGSRNTKLTLFLRVYNLLDERNEIRVWNDTGRATYTQEINVSGAGADPDWVTRPDYYSGPRRLLVGAAFDF